MLMIVSIGKLPGRKKKVDSGRKSKGSRTLPS